jgi:acetylornithine/succinyldiaminopimelate/putrescine aminotransferase
MPNKTFHSSTIFSALKNKLLHMVRGEDTSTKYVNTFASKRACALIHRHPSLVKAIQEQAAVLLHGLKEFC